jgi:peptide deformylase
MWKAILLGGIMTIAQGQASSQPLQIVTVDQPEHSILNRQTEEIQIHELALAQDIGEKLLLALKPYFPAAGLAAPQIGINKAVFIYSYDRDPKHLEIVINPTFTPIDEEKVEGWEGCLSVITTTWKIAKVPRYEKIHAVYLNQKGEWIEKDLEGFAAKVFQHEYDHLQGIVNIDRHDAIVKEFASKEELEAFMQAVKKEDATRYKNPNQ